MKRIPAVLSAAAISVWLGTIGGAVVGFNVGSQVETFPMQTPEAIEVTEALPDAS